MQRSRRVYVLGIDFFYLQEKIIPYITYVPIFKKNHARVIDSL